MLKSKDNGNDDELNLGCLCCEDPLVPMMSFATSEVAIERRFFYRAYILLRDILPALQWYHECCVPNFKPSPPFSIKGLAIAMDLSEQALEKLRSLNPVIYEMFSDLQEISLSHSDGVTCRG